MSRDKAIDDVTPTAEHAGRKGSAYLVLVYGADAVKSIAQLFEPDLTHGLMIRCDWSGHPDDPGHFQVKVKRNSNEWADIGHLTPGGDNVQLVSSGDAVTRVHVERGPTNTGVPFAVKLIPIKWLTGRVIPGEGVPVRVGDNYEYDGYTTANDMTWTSSGPNGPQGQHVVEQELTVGRDYEIWVQLGHPTDPNAKPQEQDPVIRTGANIPTSKDDTSETSDSGTH